MAKTAVLADKPRKSPIYVRSTETGERSTVQYDPEVQILLHNEMQISFITSDCAKRYAERQILDQLRSSIFPNYDTNTPIAGPMIAHFNLGVWSTGSVSETNRCFRTGEQWEAS